MMMQKQRNRLRQWTKHKWLIAVWCILWGNLTVYANTMPTYQPNAWSNTAPEYQFRSTSSYINTTSAPTFTPIADAPTENYAPRIGGIRRDLGDPTEPGIGIIADPAPVGSPLALLLFALIYALYAHFGTQRKPKPEKLKNQEE